MAILSRISRLFSADVHAVLDQLEEPAALLRQSLRDMEAALLAQTAQLQACEHDRDGIRRRLADLDRNLASIREELDLSFAAGNDALVRTSLRRRLEIERLVRALSQRAELLDAQIDQLAPALAAQRERLESLRLRATLVDVEAPRAASADAPNSAVTEADIDLALLRELNARRAS